MPLQYLQPVIPPAKHQRYLNINDATMRLGESMVRYNGNGYKNEPLYVVTSVAGHMQGLFPLSGTDVQFDPNDINVVLSSPPLGFMNYRKGSWYMSRNPSRHQKQGVCLGRLRCFSASQHPEPLQIDINKDFLRSMALAINGEHPSFDDAIPYSKSGGMSFDRFWALGRTSDDGLRVLQYKDMKVATFFVTDRRFLFVPDFLTSSKRAFLESKINTGGNNYVFDVARSFG